MNGKNRSACLVASMLIVACGAAIAGPEPESSSRGDDRHERGQAQANRLTVPQGRSIGRLTGEACLATLRRHNVGFEVIESGQAEGVDAPVRLTGDIGGVTIGSRGPSENNEILDCRLVVALLAWSADLRAADVVHIEHFSTYRPSAQVARTGEPSGHARAMAIDIGRLQRSDGSDLNILRDWTHRDRGVDPCQCSEEESEAQQTLRSLLCSAIDRGLFQIVLTPHFDAVHRNHIHLELRPDVEWSYVR